MGNRKCSQKEIIKQIEKKYKLKYVNKLVIKVCFYVPDINF